MEAYSLDIDTEQENMLGVADYISSFEHYDSVKQRQKSREDRKNHTFADDRAFADQIKNKQYKDLYSTYQGAIEQNKANYSKDNTNNKTESSKQSGRDFTSIARLLKKIE